MELKIFIVCYLAVHLAMLTLEARALWLFQVVAYILALFLILFGPFLMVRYG